MKRVLGLAIFSTLGIVACGSGPMAADPVPVAACQQRNTGTLVMANNSTNLLPRDVYIDGGSIGTLPYGSQFTRDVTAGVAHPVEFRSTVSGGIVSTASPNIVQCTTLTLTNTSRRRAKATTIVRTVGLSAPICSLLVVIGACSRRVLQAGSESEAEPLG